MEPVLDIKKRNIISAESDGNIITVKEKAFYVEIEEDDDIYLGDRWGLTIYNNPKKIKSLIHVWFTADSAIHQRHSVDDYGDEDTYTITHVFKKGSNDLYYFASSSFE